MVHRDPVIEYLSNESRNGRKPYEQHWTKQYLQIRWIQRMTQTYWSKHFFLRTYTSIVSSTSSRSSWRPFCSGSGASSCWWRQWSQLGPILAPNSWWSKLRCWSSSFSVDWPRPCQKYSSCRVCCRCIRRCLSIVSFKGLAKFFFVRFWIKAK